MGFRDYSPGLNRFLTRDIYGGALADLNMGLDPWTGNRYAFGGGNPISNVELDGHVVIPNGGGGGPAPCTSIKERERRAEAGGNPDVVTALPTGKEFPNCPYVPPADNRLQMAVICTDRYNRGSDWQYYAPDVMAVATQLDLDPRLLMAILMTESRVCLGELGLEDCQGVHRTQSSLPTKVLWWTTGQGDNASIGISNMEKKTFEAVKAAHADAFAGKEWTDVIEDTHLSILAMGYRMKDLSTVLPKSRAGNGLLYSNEEPLDFGYRGTISAMQSVALGNEPMSQHGLDHLNMFRANWAQADQLICGSGYWTCHG
jgi:hypothetical protein